MKRIEVGTHTIATVDEGNGRPLLFVHGFPLDHSMWRAQIDWFAGGAAGDYRVIAPDLRGFGESVSAEDSLPASISMKSFADDLVVLLDELRVTEPVVYCGLSMGGYIGWQFVRHNPERVHSMIMCDTKAEADSLEIARARHFMADGVVEAGTSLATRGMLERLLSPKTFESSRDVANRLQEMIDTTDPTAVAAAQRGMAERPDSCKLLPLIDAPTLFICGDGDQITPPTAMEKMVAEMPDARLEIIQDAGHMPPMEQPESINRVIGQFLQGD